MRIPTASTTTPANAEAHSARNPLRPIMGRNRTPKTPRTQAREGKTMTTKQRTTVSKTNNAKPTGEPPEPNARNARIGHDERKTDNDDAKPTTTRKQPNQALSPTPIKPRSTQKTAERLQTMTPNKKHHKTKRGTHIQIGKLTVNQNQTQTKQQTEKTTLKSFKNQPAILKRPTTLTISRHLNQLLHRNRRNIRPLLTTTNKQTHPNQTNHLNTTRTNKYIKHMVKPRIKPIFHDTHLLPQR
jgi:hypothetical protein